MRPLVSVLINSYLRIDFLERAFGSVLDQTNAGPFEIILINALEEPPFQEQFARRARDHGIDFKLVKVAPGPVGPGLLSGVRAAKADIISVLDDDDSWEPRKLAAVQAAFASDPTLAFYHNGQTFIDEDDHVLPPWNLHHLVRHPSSRLAPGTTVRMTPDDLGAARSLRTMEAMFNNSSISFHKSILDERFHVLQRLSGGEDSFLFYCALAAHTPMVATTDRLTRYRVHHHSNTAAGGRHRSFGSRVEDYSSVLLARHLHRLALCREVLTNANSSIASGMLSRDLADWNLLKDAVAGPSMERPVTADIRTLLDSEQFPLNLLDTLAVALGTGSMLSWRLTQAAFMAWRLSW